MKNLKSIILLLCLVMSSVADTKAQVEIGTWNIDGKKLKIYVYGYIVQESPDGTLMLFRGGNFVNYPGITLNPGVPNLAPYMMAHTSDSGLQLPAPDQLPVIPNYKAAWAYDQEYNVTGHVLTKESVKLKDWNKTSTSLLLFDSQKEAEKLIKTKPSTIPIGPINQTPPKPLPNGEPAGSSNGEPAGSSNGEPAEPWALGTVGYTYGSSYWAMYNELPGKARFNFYGQPGANYPPPRSAKYDGPQTANGLYIMDFPTHAVTAEAYLAAAGYVAPVKMQMWDETGNLVWEMEDYKGGIHPLNTGINNRRGNNHPDDCRRRIKPGNYRVTIENKGAYPLQFEFMNSGTWIIKDPVPAGQTKTYQIDCTKPLNDWVHYKMNCNLISKE